jgi:hypothetical protein
MAIPDYQTLMLPLLKIAGDGDIHTKQDCLNPLAIEFRVSDEERMAMLPSGKQRVFDNRVGWACTYLKKAMLIEYVQRGHFQITERGKSVLVENPVSIDVVCLRRFPEFLEFHDRTRDDGVQHEIDDIEMLLETTEETANWQEENSMEQSDISTFGLETQVRGNDVRVAIVRGEEKLGILMLSEQMVCWIPDGEVNGNTWLMTWKQFAETMQSEDLRRVVRLSESTYTSASRASAGTVKPEAYANVPVPEARENLGLRRHFNLTEYALIRKGCSDSLFIYFDPELKFRENEEGAEIYESWANRVAGQYGEYASVEQEAEHVSWVIDLFLLGRKREMPEALIV